MSSFHPRAAGVVMGERAPYEFLDDHSPGDRLSQHHRSMMVRRGTPEPSNEPELDPDALPLTLASSSTDRLPAPPN